MNNGGQLAGTAEDTHAHIRFYQLLELAFYCARNRYYQTARELAELACAHYDESPVVQNARNREEASCPATEAPADD